MTGKITKNEMSKPPEERLVTDHKLLRNLLTSTESLDRGILSMIANAKQADILRESANNSYIANK